MRRVGLLFLCLGYMLLFGSALWAQEVTLKEALERALKNNPDIAKAELSLAIAQSELRAARGDTFSPTVSIGEQIGLFGASRSGFSLQLKDTISFDTSLWEEEKVNLEKSRRSLEATQEEVKRRVVVAYLEVLRGERELALAQKSLELSREKLRRLEEEYGKGEAAAFLLKEAQGECREKEAVVASLKAQLQLYKERFFALLGEEMQGDPTFAPLPEFSLFLPEEAHLSDFVDISDTLEDLKGQQQVLEASLLRLRRAERPHIALEGTYGKDEWSFSTKYDFSQRSLDVVLERSLALSGSSPETFGVGLVISWDFSPSLAEQKKQVTLKKEMLLLDLATARQNVLFDLREKYLAVLKAREILESRKAVLEAQEEAFAIRKEQFALGALDAVTFLESELQFLTAQKEYENARYDLLESFLAFLRATETPISWETLFAPQGGEKE